MLEPKSQLTCQKRKVRYEEPMPKQYFDPADNKLAAATIYVDSTCEATVAGIAKVLNFTSEQKASFNKEYNRVLREKLQEAVRENENGKGSEEVAKLIVGLLEAKFLFRT